MLFINISVTDKAGVSCPQVTGLAFNPFRDFDDKPIVGSIGSVLMSSSHRLLQVHDLVEDIEVGLDY